MKKIAIVIGLAIVAIGGLMFMGSSNPTVNKNVAFAQVQQEVKKDATLYDVRTPEEFSAGHFQNATLLPLQDIQAGKLPKEAKDKKLYVYCRSGNRSSQAKALLEKAGYTDVVDLGGLSDVQAAGGKLITKEG